MAELAHSCTLHLPQAFLVAPAHLALDLLFLEFLKGERMFPFPRKDTVTFEEILPDYCMPKCRARCRLFNKFWTATEDLEQQPLPQIRYDCTCTNPYSLMCQSTSKVVCTYWLDKVQEYFKEQQANNPYPFVNITNFNLLIISTAPNRDGTLHYILNPLAHLHDLLTHRAVRNNYALSRIPGGYEILITPSYGNERLMEICRHLQEGVNNLPFRIRITCYPFCQIKN
ncbi:ORF14A [Aviadenovirus cerasi]|uniref:ORF14A n=1 Tax=Fowl aviadenovirus 5 TaxID=172861 RepID=A0A6M3Z4Y3_9ADEN|nr:ORF14A [Fowl aviadenovirus 5]